MNEFYVEQMVMKKFKKSEVINPILTVILGFGLMINYGLVRTSNGPFSMIMVLVSSLLIAGGVVNLYRLDTEYEYLCTNGDLDFDKIIRKSKRKNLFSIAGDNIVVIAKDKAQELHQYKGVKVYNLSSNEPGRELYKLIAKDGERMIGIIFEPGQEMVEKLWTRFPRKVFK